LNPEEAAGTLREDLERAGFRIGLASLDRAGEVRAYFAGLLENGLLERSFHESHLTGFDSGPPEDFPGARSVMPLGSPRCG
jgi:hypothetical protein